MGCFTLEKLSLIIILIALFLLSAKFETCYAREGKYWRQSRDVLMMNKEKAHDGRSLSMVMDSNYTWSDEKGQSLATFNVLDYGAKGDGRTDDTKAFEAAWIAACKVEASTIVVPSGSMFLVHPISFSGPACAENIVFQLDGKIIAPTSATAWGSGLLQWIEFTKLKGITIKGKGIIDGQGSVWWNDLPAYSPHSEVAGELNAKMPGTKPTALRFYGSTDVTVTGITIQNSPQTHLKFDDCTGVQVSEFTAASPENSPNTDGIHLQNSRDVVIYSSDLSCGDDCVSIQTGCSNVYIHNVNCGPGHGISIGGLGKDNTKACVSNVTVRDVQMQNTLTGVRIKTWQGGSGSVQGVTFSNIQVSGVETPIMIDQFYCDGSKCRNESSAVAVSGINYMNIKGTYTRNPLHLACSDNSPCTGVSLETIELKSVGENSQPFCWNTYGELRSATVPPVNCLQTGKSRKPYIVNC
ncbi:Polygalacturonase precursor, putative [Ricinus communis]|uniref:Polygalacturonase, putative n=2 Tax=Ricinus communis TaxID=3988 RepID=B9S631_RICCO|nr:Polygalacturonase precursor, putative [Ricinus communis]